MGENHFANLPTAAYGGVLLGAAIAYFVLQSAIIAEHGPGSTLKAALGTDVKGKISPALFVVAIPMAFVSRWVALGLYVVVSLMWLVPDRRIASQASSA